MAIASAEAGYLVEQAEDMSSLATLAHQLQPSRHMRLGSNLPLPSVCAIPTAESPENDPHGLGLAPTRSVPKGQGTVPMIGPAQLDLSSGTPACRHFTSMSLFLGAIAALVAVAM